MASVVRTRRPAEQQVQHDEPPPSKPSMRIRAVNQLVLLSYDQIPAWYQDNKHILHGYRPSTNSAIKCLLSWSHLHNESVNIYTHLLPALCFAGLEVFAYRHFKTLYPEATVMDRVVFAFFLLAVVVCLGLSTAYHTLMNHSAEVSQFWLRMDYLGIVGLILGNIVSGTYVVFYCQRSLQTFYSGMALSLSTVTCLILLNPKFQGRQWRLFRTSAFVCTGLSALAPLAHGTTLFGTTYMLKHSGLSYYLLEGLLHVLGVFVYAIFHVLVVLATVTQLFGVWSAFDYKYTNRECQVYAGSGGR